MSGLDAFPCMSPFTTGTKLIIAKVERLVLVRYTTTGRFSSMGIPSFSLPVLVSVCGCPLRSPLLGTRLTINTYYPHSSGKGPIMVTMQPSSSCSAHSAGPASSSSASSCSSSSVCASGTKQRYKMSFCPPPPLPGSSPALYLSSWLPRAILLSF